VTAKLNYDMDTLVHKLNADIKVMKKDGFVDLLLWDGSHFYDAFRNNSEIAFVSQDELVNIWT